MRPPNKRRASYRLNPAARDQLCALATKRNQTQTAVLEGLINDAADGADAYFKYHAAYYSWMSFLLILDLVRTDLGDEFPERLRRVKGEGIDIFGDMPSPPIALCDRARARLEAGNLSPGWVRVLRSYELLDGGPS